MNNLFAATCFSGQIVFYYVFLLIEKQFLLLKKLFFLQRVPHHQPLRQIKLHINIILMFQMYLFITTYQWNTEMTKGYTDNFEKVGLQEH